MRLRVYGCAWKCVEVLASFFTCACSRRIFVSVCEFVFKREEFFFRVSLLEHKKKVERTQSKQSYFFSRLSSRGRRSRFPRASGRFSAPLSRSRSQFKARAWRGREGGDVAASRAKLVSVC
jgi:hypothetical protein